MCALQRLSLSHKSLEELNKNVQNVLLSYGQKEGRKYIHISKDFSVNSTDNQNEASSFSDLKRLISILQKVKVSNSDQPLLKMTIEGLQKISMEEFPNEKLKIDTVFQTTVANSEDPQILALKNTNLYRYFHGARPQHMDTQINVAIKKGLTEFEAHGAYFYTTDAYKILNAYMRGQDEVVDLEIGKLFDKVQKEIEFVEGIKKEFSKKYSSRSLNKEQFIRDCKGECDLVVKALKSGLSALPKTDAQALYRGDLLSDEELKLMNSKLYFDKGVMSFSRDLLESKNWALRPSTNPLEKHRVLIILENSKQGRDVKSISSNPKENEVLLLPGQKLEVVEIKQLELGSAQGYEIRVKESNV